MPLLAVTERQADGSPILEEGEGMIYAEPNVALFFDLSQVEGVGSLYITSKHIIWLNSADPSKGYSMDYYFISIHALSTDTTSFPHPCIYCQLESNDIPEARFVPQQTDHLQLLYKAFCDGAVLNPDEEEEGEGDFIFNEEEVEMGLRGQQFFPGRAEPMEAITRDMEGLSTNDNRFADGDADGDDAMN